MKTVIITVKGIDINTIVLMDFINARTIYSAYGGPVCQDTILGITIRRQLSCNIS